MEKAKPNKAKPDMKAAGLKAWVTRRARKTAEEQAKKEAEAKAQVEKPVKKARKARKPVEEKPLKPQVVDGQQIESI